MKQIGLLLILLGMLHACTSMNASDLINSTVILDPNETCFYFVDLNGTAEHNNTVPPIVYNITENITIVENTTIVNCTLDYLDLTFTPETEPQSISVSGRNLSVTVLGYTVPECPECNFTEENCTVCEDSQNCTLDYIDLILNPGDSGNSTSHYISWLVNTCAPGEITCPTCQVCEQCDRNKCEIPSNYINIEAWDWKNIPVGPNQEVELNSRRVTCYGTTASAVPAILSGCTDPVLRWYCNSPFKEYCTDEELLDIDYGTCMERISYCGDENSTISELEESLSGLRGDLTENEILLDAYKQSTEMLTDGAFGLAYIVFGGLGFFLVGLALYRKYEERKMGSSLAGEHEEPETDYGNPCDEEAES